MRYMTIVKSSEPFGTPPPALLEAIGKLAEEAIKAGVFIETGGLLPTAMGSRVRLSGGKITVTDGPFTEAKELIAGYTIIQAKSKEEAMEWSRRFPNPAGPGKEAEIEVRQLYELEDFGPVKAAERFREMEKKYPRG